MQLRIRPSWWPWRWIRPQRWRWIADTPTAAMGVPGRRWPRCPKICSTQQLFDEYYECVYVCLMDHCECVWCILCIGRNVNVAMFDAYVLVVNCRRVYMTKLIKKVLVLCLLLMLGSHIHDELPTKHDRHTFKRRICCCVMHEWKWVKIPFMLQSKKGLSIGRGFGTTSINARSTLPIKLQLAATKSHFHIGVLQSKINATNFVEFTVKWRRASLVGVGIDQLVRFEKIN